MYGKRGVFIVVASVIILLFGTLWVYDSFVSPESKKVKLGNEDKLLQSYVKETMLSEYVPAQLSVQKKLLSDGTFRGADYTYGTIWSAGEGAIYGFLNYNQNLTALTEMGVLIQLNQTINLDQETATALVKKYAKGQHPLNCETRSNSVIVCEEFITQKSVESGIGVFALPQYNLVAIFSCKHFDGLLGRGSCLQRGG